MTLQLILTRHAKSDWHDPMMSDHERPLNRRGQGDATDLGHWLNEVGLCPDQVLCSSAQRTRETWERIAKQLDTSPKADYLDELYLPLPQTMLEVLRGATGKRVMMLAHNPGTGLTAAALTNQPLATAQFDKYPTAATTVLEFDLDDWSNVQWGDGQIRQFVTPAQMNIAAE